MPIDKMMSFLINKLTIYIMQLIATQLQLNQNNSFSSTMQLHYNCTHDVMLMSLIIIHLLKSYTWHYDDFWHKIVIFQNIDLHRPL